MGRPRQGLNRRKTITVSLSPEAITKLADMGTNRSAIIESLIMGPPTNSLRAALDAKIQPVDKPCTHPREQRVVHSWGTRCGTCGQRL